MPITRITDAGQIHQHNKIILATNAPQDVAHQFIVDRHVDRNNLNDEEWAFMLVDNELGYFTQDGDNSNTYDDRNGALHEISTQLNSFQSKYPSASIYFCDAPDNIHTITLGDYFASVEKKRLELANFDEIQKPWWTNKWYMIGAGVTVILLAGGAYWWWSQKKKEAEDDENEDGDSTRTKSKKGNTKSKRSSKRRERIIPNFDDYDIEEDDYD